jgi:AcrR family transcriptional regulator
MGSPAPSRVEQRKAELRREIVAASFDCFAERGYHATGIADIAARLGIGHGTFYRYFANKRDIDDLIARIRAALGDENAPDAVSTLEEYRLQSARIGEAVASLIGADPRVPRLLLLEAPGVDAELRERVLDFIESMAEVTAAYFSHGVELGYLRADLDVTASARAVNGMILGAVVHGIRHHDEQSQAQLTGAIQRLMYDGIAAR